jgi:hypothetical protein
MPRFRKTSTQPKRKPKKSVKIVKPVYPEYIEKFIQEVESKTPFKVKIDQYEEGAAYHVGVNQIIGRVQRCIWMVGFATGSEHLQSFWSSLAMKDVTIKST